MNVCVFMLSYACRFDILFLPVKVFAFSQHADLLLGESNYVVFTFVGAYSLNSLIFLQCALAPSKVYELRSISATW